MKIFVASDIHGSAYWCRKMLEAYEAEKADFLLLLGDVLYHGPRNDLPEEYAPKKVIEMLNPYADDIMCVRGNCESEVDQMVLDFLITSPAIRIKDRDARIFATHGHVWNEDNLPRLREGEILLCGHTHVQVVREHEHYTYVNPGSVSIPKENTPHGYAIIENGEVTLKSL